MFDLMVLAFQGDVTRVCTFMYANEGSNRSYPFIGVPEGHHDLSHHGGDPKKHEKIKKINRFHIEQFAYLLGKLKSIREGDGSLLDNVDDRLRQRDQRRQPPQPRQPAGPARGQGGRHDQARPASQGRTAAAEQPLSFDARSHRRLAGLAWVTAPGGWGSLTGRRRMVGRPLPAARSLCSASSCFLASAMIVPFISPDLGSG